MGRMPTNVVGMECTCSAGRGQGRVSTHMVGTLPGDDVTAEALRRLHEGV